VQTGILLTVVPTGLALVLYLGLFTTFALTMARRRRTQAPLPVRAPRITVMKPLAGADDDLAANLDSFAAIDYPSFEVLLGVASPADPAAAVAIAFLERHPKLDARLVLTDPDVAVNPKVAQLILLDRHSTGEIVVISDSNVRVPPGYLWSLGREMDDPAVGLVTSVFVGTGERSVGAALENLQLGSYTAPGIVAGATLLRRPFTVGKSMAMRRRDLVRLGALHAVGGVLAEDHVLGRIFADAGYKLRTSLDLIENRNVDCTVRRTLERHSRWAKMRRTIAPLPFALEPIVSPLAVATLIAATMPSRLALMCVLVASILQTSVAFVSVRILRGRSLAWYYAPLEVVRTYAVLACWAWAWLSRRITWRGHAFLLTRDSAIVPAPPRSWSRLVDLVRA
jgi:ceramide glucosyltransferase